MNETRKNQFNPNYAVPPGAVLEEWLEERGMSQTELAGRMNWPIKTINELIKGKTSFTQETAFQLEAVTGIEASFWTNADRIYQERASRRGPGAEDWMTVGLGDRETGRQAPSRKVPRSTGPKVAKSQGLT